MLQLPRLREGGPCFWDDSLCTRCPNVRITHTQDRPSPGPGLGYAAMLPWGRASIPALQLSLQWPCLRLSIRYGVRVGLPTHLSRYHRLGCRDPRRSARGRGTRPPRGPHAGPLATGPRRWTVDLAR
ncbi:unnamed protein product [Rangifer tarandus platyrhynchus]|uniref:Uncharacterized protein n=2 Tax=Rangifer tarandus platyrhynchus TaxID=3082113 RepID=A0ACB0E677_RANTA|nr:unnamed protein product [Rangifer tarandus platyrhynchus]CAI9695982.1 unnamed protein product [Rangifer tarandus platyrhynchus]